MSQVAVVAPNTIEIRTKSATFVLEAVNHILRIYAVCQDQLREKIVLDYTAHNYRFSQFLPGKSLSITPRVDGKNVVCELVIDGQSQVIEGSKDNFPDVVAQLLRPQVLPNLPLMKELLQVLKRARFKEIAREEVEFAMLLKNGNIVRDSCDLNCGLCKVFKLPVACVACAICRVFEPSEPEPEPA